MPNMKISIELLEGLVVKLSMMIVLWESESANDRFLKVLDLGLSDVCQGLDFHPFDEVIDGD